MAQPQSRMDVVNAAYDVWLGYLQETRYINDCPIYTSHVAFREKAAKDLFKKLNELVAIMTPSEKEMFQDRVALYKYLNK